MGKFLVITKRCAFLADNVASNVSDEKDTELFNAREVLAVPEGGLMEKECVAIVSKPIAEMRLIVEQVIVVKNNIVEENGK